MSEPLVSVVAVILLLAPLLPFVAFLVLVQHLASGPLSLRERAGLALRDLLVSSFIAFLAANRLFSLGYSGDLLGLLFAVALLLVSLPSGVWLWLFYTGRFRAD